MLQDSEYLERVKFCFAGGGWKIAKELLFSMPNAVSYAIFESSYQFSMESFHSGFREFLQELSN